MAVKRPSGEHLAIIIHGLCHSPPLYSRPQATNSHIQKGIFLLELSSIVLEIPNDAYTTLCQNLMLRRHHFKGYQTTTALTVHISAAIAD